MRITKAEAARRQLDVAIALLFTKEDLVAVHTLTGAAAEIASELRQSADAPEPWSFKTPMVCGLDENEYFSIMRSTRDYLGSAKSEAFSIEDFSVPDTIALIAQTNFALGELSLRLSVSQSIFQLWFLACQLDSLSPSFEHAARIRAIFGNISRRTMNYRLSVGRRVLLEEMDRILSE